jgi:5-methylcytosine-specific restriction endonuclease McrA
MTDFPKDKPVRLKGPALAALRKDRYIKDEGRCVGCGKKVCLENGGWLNAHMAHVVGRGAGGSDTIDNVRTKCMECHLVGDHNPKPVPPKPQRAEDGSWVN